MESSVNTVEKTVTVSAFITSPFGDDFINRSATKLEWLGYTEPITIKDRGGDAWVWYYGIDDALEDNYEARVTATDMQGNSVFGSSYFTIGKPPDPTSWRRDGHWYLILSEKCVKRLVLFLLICILLLVLFVKWRRRRKGRRRDKEGKDDKDKKKTSRKAKKEGQ